MRTLPIGFLLTCAVIFFSMKLDAWALYLNAHAIIIVWGGTFTILVMSTPSNTLRNLYYSVSELFKKTQTITLFTSEFKELMQKKTLQIPSPNPLIRYASELWEQGVDAELFIVLISQRRDELERGYIDAVQALRNLAKYPPALGMTGTVMGLVSLFSVLGADNQAALGPSLALAMTATFFGLITANCIVTPLADHLHVRHMQNEKLYTGVYQILILINRGEAPALVNEEVKGRAA